MTDLAKRPVAPGLLAFDGKTPVGWVALAPREEYVRVDRSRATPRVDDVDVWVIPCITVAKPARGKGVAVTLLRAAADYAFANGAPAIEAYPRAGRPDVSDDNAFYGTQALFEKAGYEMVRGELPNRPKTWAARVTMRRVGLQVSKL